MIGETTRVISPTAKSGLQAPQSGDAGKENSFTDVAGMTLVEVTLPTSVKERLTGVSCDVGKIPIGTHHISTHVISFISHVEFKFHLQDT